jgi:septum formation protein
MQKLVLASQSPRRKELLSRAGFKFTVLSIQISEIPDENLNLQDQIEDLARKKAEACLNSGKLAKGQSYLILSSDTVVVLDGQILGKPPGRPENAQGLRRLSGRKHSVITSVCLLDVDSGQVALGHSTSKIEFRELSDDEILAYVATGEGLDKAGGYGIQGAAGRFVASLDGPMDTVVGLPIALVEKLLNENGWHVDRN